MRLPRLAIQNHQFTIVLVALLLTLGLVSFLTMPRSEDPSVQPAGASVFVIYPGATPADIEELIVEPLEEAINEIDDIKTMTGTAEDFIDLRMYQGVFEHSGRSSRRVLHSRTKRFEMP